MSARSSVLKTAGETDRATFCATMAAAAAVSGLIAPDLVIEFGSL